MCDARLYKAFFPVKSKDSVSHNSETLRHLAVRLPNTTSLVETLALCLGQQVLCWAI